MCARARGCACERVTNNVRMDVRMGVMNNVRMMREGESRLAVRVAAGGAALGQTHAMRERADDKIGRAHVHLAVRVAAGGAALGQAH